MNAPDCFVEWTQSGAPMRVTSREDIAREWVKQGAGFKVTRMTIVCELVEERADSTEREDGHG